jgi:Uma2 family endonuclease
MAMRASATYRVASPVATLWHRSLNAAKPSGSRLRASAAAKFFGDGVAAHVSFADVRLRPFERLFYYPDVVVTCDPSDDDQLFIARPCLVVEVLSESTATIDRREKLFTYRQIETLLAYVVVHQDEPRIERHWRDATGEWWSIDVVGDSTLPIPCPETQLPLSVIYESVHDVGISDSGD